MGVISTIEASCRDCYKCVRFCPVKAIKVIHGHAEVIESRCLGDGRCVTVCPQKAKKVESGIEEVKKFLESGVKTAASIAPSFVAAMKLDNPRQVVTVLKKLGFTFVEETAEGAEWVAKEHLRLVRAAEDPVISSCCPAIVNLMEIYYPELLTFLAPVVSPMVAHGRIMKARYGSETKVVFIGPCIAKKDECRREENLDSIDAVLTFAELGEILAEENIEPSAVMPGCFDSESALTAHAFATPGGLARSATLSTDLLAEEVVTIDGLDECIAFLDKFHENRGSLRLIELLACRGGCVMGPGITGEEAAYARRNRVISYAGHRLRERGLNEKNLPSVADMKADIKREFSIKPKLDRVYAARGETYRPGEEEIRRILNRTGKFQPEDELNCGACGYNSCREKAVAVARGMAEIDMCIPYMRAKAESRANLICRVTPNAIFVVGSDLKILEVNPAAERKFHCRQEQVAGKELQTILDPRHFKEALRRKELVTGEVSFPAYGIVAWQAVFYVEKEDVIIGIFADITREKQQRERLARVTGETLEKAQEVINKQMRVAQEIAGLLGETTAETKVLLTKLIKLIQNEDGEG